MLAVADASDKGEGIDAAITGTSVHDGKQDSLMRAIEMGCLDCLYQKDESHDTRQYAAGVRDRFRELRATPQSTRRTIFSHWERPDEAETTEHDQLHRCLAAVLNNVVEMVYVHDEAGLIQYANERCTQVTGYTRDELLAPMSIHDFLPPEFGELVADRLATLGPGDQSPFTLDIVNRHGRRIPLEFRLQHLPLEVAPGERENFVLVCAHDCHLSRQLEHRLEAMADLERRVIEALPIGVVVTDGDLVICAANPIATVGIGAASREDMIDLPIHEVIASADLGLRDNLAKVVETGEEWRSEYHGSTKFGVDVRFDMTVVPLDGPKSGVIVLLRDIENETGRNLAIVQAQKLQALGTTVAGVSHELNNPLTGIVGYTQLLLASDIPPSIRTRVDHIAMEARRAQRIVQNLLTFAQRHETRKSLHDVNRVVQNVLTLQEYQMRVDGVTLDVDLAEDLPPTLIDVNALQTVCLHIINNAHQALVDSEKADKRLRVRTFVQDGFIHAAFEDSGQGISSDLQTRIFDPFFTTREPGAGPGLGLSVSYGIMQDHGGRIQLDSVPGEGSTFTIILPIREESVEDPLVRGL